MPVLPSISTRASLLASLFDAGVVTALAAPRLADDELFAEERRYIAAAVPKRRAEFATARLCAREALARLGVATCPLVPHPDRSPYWPPGISGSISHTNGCCAVAVTRMPVRGIGLDIESDTALGPGLEARVCTPAEREWLDGAGPGERERLAKLFFSAKEAFYKCQYGASRTPLGFHDVTLEIDTKASTFAVAEIARSGAIWDIIRRAKGTLARGGELIMTAAVLAPEAGIQGR